MNDLPTRRAFNRHGARVLDQQIDDALAQQKAERDAAREAARASQQAQKALQGSVSRDDLVKAGAADIGDPLFERTYGVHVRDLTGWHQVIRLNRVTVVVPGPWGGEHAIRIDKLIELKA